MAPSIQWQQVAAVSFFIVCSLAAVLLNKALFKNYEVLFLLLVDLSLASDLSRGVSSSLVRF